MNSKDVRQLRRELDDLEARIQHGPLGANLAGTVFLARTATDGNYPAIAQCVYKVEILIAGGPEVEGGAFEFTETGMHLYAANLGTAVPPLGTIVECFDVHGGRHAFQYFGGNN